MLDLDSLTIEAAKKAIASGATSATALAEMHYTRIEDQDARLNSFLASSRDRAMLQAAKIDRMVKSGDDLPPLAGIPFGIKDVLAMKGSPTTAGSLILKEYPSPYDASVVTKLEAA